MPLNLTAVAPVNPDPLIVTVVPAVPPGGSAAVIAGAGLTVTVTGFDVAGFEVTHAALDVITQLMTSPLLSEDELYTLLFVPTFTLPLFHW